MESAPDANKQDVFRGAVGVTPDQLMSAHLTLLATQIRELAMNILHDDVKHLSGINDGGNVIGA